MKNNQNITKIAELPDSNGKCIICKKIDDRNQVSYIFKNVWPYGQTEWHELGPLEFKHFFTLQFGAEKTAELMSK